MPVYKRKYKSGRVTWGYFFDGPGSTREQRRKIVEAGFGTKREAEEAEAKRRVEEHHKYEIEQLERSKAGSTVDAPLPQTLGMLLDVFFDEHSGQRLAPKTDERYREQAAYLSPELKAMALNEITPLHLTREWNRLLQSGGRHRKTKQARQLSKKTVRNIAGVVSSAYSRAVKWGLTKYNPVPDSDPPHPVKREGVALAPSQATLLLEAGQLHWALPVFLELADAGGARRGEILALRWSDIRDGGIMIERSLTQTKKGLFFKEPKNRKVRFIELPDSALRALEGHRRKQEEFRMQYGPGYRTDLDLVFANPDGSLLKPDSISAAVSALCRRLKLPKGANLHALRHSHGSHLLAGGVDLPKVSERLGHSSVYVTATVYAHALKGKDRETVRKWEEFRRRSLGSDFQPDSKPS